MTAARLPAPAVLAFLALAGLATAQPLPPPPTHGPAPLLYVRFEGPPGTHVTVFPGNGPGRVLPAPLTVGLRPGYVHRVQLSGLPGLAGSTISPTIEVRGSLCASPKLRAADHPAPIIFTVRDVERILSGSLVTKVVYLEHPEKAILAPGPGPLEMDYPASTHLLEEARNFGRPMLVVHAGQRQVTAEELARSAVAGTALLPGDRALLPPPVPPCLPWGGVKLYDPVLGPKLPEEECLIDGGDRGRPAGLDGQGRVLGLDPSDTVAEYSDSSGRRHLAISNKVCVCVPRYAVLRSELPLEGVDSVVVLGDAQAVKQRVQLDLRLPHLETTQAKQLNAIKGRMRPSATIADVGLDTLVKLQVLRAEHLDIGPAVFLGTKRMVLLEEIQRVKLAKQIKFALELSKSVGLQEVQASQGTVVVARAEGLGLVRATAETREITICCSEEPKPPEKPLCLFKWCNAHAAKLGDVVTFYLRYSNQGGRPITDVAVSDSLTGRLEYVPGTAKSDRDAVFTLQQNDAGSVILRWEIGGKLLPGESGVVSFKVRIR
jgi:uncharacterized repeat protein (TIGR01451 family)